MPSALVISNAPSPLPRRTEASPPRDRLPTDVGVVLPGLCSSPDDRYARSQPADLRPPCHPRGPAQYDCIVRQHAALSQGTIWHEINPSLHASTVLSYRTDPGHNCNICHEPDHMADTCAMLALQSAPPSMASLQMLLPRPQPPGRTGATTSAAGPICRPVRPDTGTHLCLLEQRKM